MHAPYLFFVCFNAWDVDDPSGVYVSSRCDMIDFLVPPVIKCPLQLRSDYIHVVVSAAQRPGNVLT